MPICLAYVSDRYLMLSEYMMPAHTSAMVNVLQSVLSILSSLLQGLDDDGSASDEPAPESHESTTDQSQSHGTVPQTGLLPPWGRPYTMPQTHTHIPANAAQEPFTQHLNPSFEHQRLSLPAIPPLLAVPNNSAPQANPPFQHHSLQTDHSNITRTLVAGASSTQMPQQASESATITHQPAQTESDQAGSVSLSQVSLNANTGMHSSPSPAPSHMQFSAVSSQVRPGVHSAQLATNCCVASFVIADSPFNPGPDLTAGSVSSQDMMVHVGRK